MYRLTDLNHIFRKSVFGKADLDLGKFSKLTLEGVYGLPGKDWFLRAGVKWSVIDGLELNVRADLPGGPRDSFFGSFEGNRRLQIRLKYFF